MNLTENQYLNELRATAFHEAGHKYVCQRFGGDGDILITKNQSESLDECTWSGHFKGRRSPDGLYDHSGERVGLLPANWQVLVGMAGLVAEALLDEELLAGGTELADNIWELVEFRIWAGEASATDLEFMGISDTDDVKLNFDDVEQTVQYLVEGWDRVVSDAEFWMDYALDEASPSQSHT